MLDISNPKKLQYYLNNVVNILKRYFVSTLHFFPLVPFPFCHEKPNLLPFDPLKKTIHLYKLLYSFRILS